MASTITPATKRPVEPIRRFSVPTRRHKIIIFAVVVSVVLCLAIGLYYMRVLSFSEKAVIQNLSEASGSTVTVRGYRRTQFPSPGCVLEGVEFRQGGNRFTIISIDRLVIKGTYLGILRHHVHHIKAVGAHIFIPPFGTHFTFQTVHSNIVVDEIVANGTLVDYIYADPSKKPVRFDVHEGLLTDVRWGSPIRYLLKFHNPEPPGEISVSGDFGPWADGHPQDTPLSGDYSFDHADLSVYGGIAGLLASTGKFEGPFKHINVTGGTSVPDFEVTSGGHKVKLETKFDAFVDATHGDTFLKRVEAKFGRTTVIADGSVAGAPGYKGKVARLRLTSHRGRIENILGLFVSASRSPMSGEANIQARAEIPPGDAPFLKRVKLDGAFGIGEGTFSSRERQKNVDELSAGARGQNKEDPETVLIDLKGQVILSGGIAQFSDLSFGVAGAKARMRGTYNLLNYKIDLHGVMQVDTKISKTSSGVKALFLKMMDPFFKKKKKGEIVPVHIEGTYEKPQFGLDLTTPQEAQAQSSRTR